MRRALPLAALLATACGELFVAPPKNLNRPSAMVVVTDAVASATSPEYIFILDTDRAQAIVADTVGQVLVDLHPDIPGFNGVFLDGQPIGLAARADGQQVAVTNFLLGKLQVICTPIDPQCPTPRIVEEIDVGDSPEGVTLVGRRAYVTRPRHGIVVEVDVDAASVQRFFTVGGSPRGLGATPDGARLYVANSAGPAISRVDLSSGEVRSVTLGFPTREIFISPNPTWVYALRADRGTLLVVDPGTDALVNVNAGGPALLEPDIALTFPITSMAFQTFTEAEQAAIGVGQFAYVSTIAGTMFVLDTELPNEKYPYRAPHHTTDRAPPAEPVLSKVPGLFRGNVNIAVTNFEPVLLGFNVDPEFGVRFRNKSQRIHRTEDWTVTYEGVISGASPTRAHLEAEDVLTNVDVRFPEITMLTGEKALRDDDLVVLLDIPTPRAGVDCTEVEVDFSTGLRRRWRLTLMPERPNSVRLRAGGNPPPNLPPLVDCYTALPLSYEVRVPGAWAVTGTRSGFLGRAPECPNTTPDAQCQPYENPFFSITLKAGTRPSEVDIRWNFGSLDGVSEAVVGISSSFQPAGLPRAVAASRRPDKNVYVLDEGDEAIIFVNAASLLSFRVVR